MNTVAPTVVFRGSKSVPCSPSAPETLDVNDSAVVLVRARHPANFTPFQVEQGSDYEFYALPYQSWVDFFIPSSAAGYARGPVAPVQELFRGLKPLPQVNWFALVGAIGRPTNHPFLIGDGRKLVTVAANGRLILFANDAAGFYWNNFGSLAVAITRVK